MGADLVVATFMGRMATRLAEPDVASVSDELQRGDIAALYVRDREFAAVGKTSA